MDKAPKKEKKAQNKLRDAVCEDALQYKLLFNSMAESFALSELVFDSNGEPADYRYLEVNRSFEKFIGLRRREIVGKLRSAIPIPLTQSSFKIYSRVALTGKPAQFKNYNAAMGKYYIVNVYSPIKNQFAAVFNDITGQERADKKIKHLASFPQMNPNPVIEISANGRILFLNKAAKKFLSGFKTDVNEKSILPSDMHRILAVLKENKPKKTYFYRKVSIGGKIVAEDIHISKKLNTVRIYAKDITERTQAEEASKISELKYRRLFESAKDGILILDFETGIIVDANPFLLIMLGYSYTDILKKHIWDIGFLKDIVSSKNAFSELQKKEFIRYENLPLETKNGKKMFVEFVSNAYFVDGKKVIQCNIRDITERKLAEENLNRLNRTLEALNGINHSILRAKNEKEFLAEVCRIIVQDCGHKMVWIGYADDNEEKTVRPVSWAGFEDGYLETLKITWADRDRGHGPTGTAIRTGKPQQCKNMIADPQFEPWREEALKRGYASSIAIPLKAGNKILGAIMIYSKNPDPFTDDEIRLLIQLANDTAYGIYTLNLRQNHATAIEKLRETSEYLDNLINYANAPIIVWDPNFKITKFNTACEQLTGLKSETAVGKSLGILFPAKSKKESMKMIRSTLAGKRWEVVEIPIKRVDGKIRHVVWNSANILSDSNKVVATIAQGQDITERKIAEEKRGVAEIAIKNHARELENAVRELENLHLAVENASDIIFIADPQGVILSINKAVENLLGCNPREMIGKKMRILGQASNQVQYNKMWEMIKNDKNNFVAEIENHDKAGRKMIFELYVSPVLDNKSEIIFLVGVVRDRTEAKIADRAKTEFISLAAHQLRTPLSTISMASEMLTNGNVGQIDETAKEQLQEICATAHKMAEMIELFLNISRIELGRLDINPELTDIVDFARDLSKEIAPQINAKKISLKTDFAVKIPEVNIDRKIMHIALENLLTNAIKYTRENGKIIFSVKTENGNIVAKVSDNGRGIPKNELPLIFNKMFRATNVGESKGMGLGLNMTKSAVEQCGGSISVESEENKGSTFSISIPASGMKKKKIRIEQ